MTRNRSLSPSPSAALHLLRALGIIKPLASLPRTDADWESLAFLRPGTERRLLLLARSLGTADGKPVPLGLILAGVDRTQACALVEAVAIAVGMPAWGAQIAASARQGSPKVLPRWVQDDWTPVQAATALIARRAFSDPKTYLGDFGPAYDWRYAMRTERFADAAIVGEAIESDPPVDIGKILRTNAGWFNGTYLAAFTVAAGITTDGFINRAVLWELTQAAALDGLTPHIHEPLVVPGC